MFGRKYDRAKNEQMERLAKKMIETGELTHEESVRVLGWLTFHVLELKETTAFIRSWLFKALCVIVCTLLIIILKAESSQVGSMLRGMFGL